MKIAIFLTSIIFFVGCSSKTTISAIKPAEVGDSDIRAITVLNFEDDDIGLASSIRAKMSEISFENGKYFSIVNRDDIKHILNEQKLLESGFVNSKSDIQNVGLSEVKSIMSGKVINTKYNRNYYQEERTDYNYCVEYARDKKGNSYCVRYRKYFVDCATHTYSIEASISINRVSNGDNIFSDSYNKNKSISKCSDSSTPLLPKESMYSNLAKEIASILIKKIAPSKESFEVILLDDIDTDYSSTDKNLLKSALALIETKRIDRANEILDELVNNTKSNSITALYNLAVTEEAIGNIEKAIELYKKAEDIAIRRGKIIDELSIAIKRVEKNLINQQKALQQIQNN